MIITKARLKQIIKEELENVVEGVHGLGVDDGGEEGLSILLVLAVLVLFVPDLKLGYGPIQGS